MSKKLLQEKEKLLKQKISQENLRTIMFKQNEIKPKLTEKRDFQLSFLPHAKHNNFIITISHDDSGKTLRDVVPNDIPQIVIEDNLRNVVPNNISQVIIENDKVIQNDNRILAHRIEKKNIARKINYVNDKKVNCVDDYTKRFIKRKRTEIEKSFKESNKRVKIDECSHSPRLHRELSPEGIIFL
jgi:hypothetical protein